MTFRSFQFAFFLLACLCLHGAARGDEAEPLGDYENQAVRDALKIDHLEIAPDPEGKLVGEIHVVTLPVFSTHDGRFQFFNAFHRTSRASIVRREVLLTPGRPWDRDSADETERKLRDPLFSSLATVVPVRSARAGYVDVLVVTRDVWSLRTNSDFEVQGGSFSKLILRPSENNFWGHRKQVSAIFEMDLGAFSVGPGYWDPNIKGTHLELRTSGGVIFDREDGEYEGTRSETTFGMPLWSLERRWGASIRVAHDDSIFRLFEGAELSTYDAPDTPGDDLVPYRYENRTVDVDTAVVRATGDELKTHLTLGHQLRITRPGLLPGFVGSQIVRDAFIRDILPRSERSSALFVRYRVFTPRFVAYRNVQLYDLPEVVRIGPDASVELATAARLMYSEKNFARLHANAEWTFELPRQSLVRARASVDTRFQRSDDEEIGLELIDNEIGIELAVVAPELRHAIRVLVRASVVEQINEKDNNLFVAGGQTGLRGYPVGAFKGKSRVVTNVEIRSHPVPVWFTRAGGLVFWDMGHAAGSLSDLGMRHDVGVGLRFLVPQTSVDLYRIDWAFPLEGSPRLWPGRITLGFERKFE